MTFLEQLHRRHRIVLTVSSDDAVRSLLKPIAQLAGEFGRPSRGTQRPTEQLEQSATAGRAVT